MHLLKAPFRADLAGSQLAKIALVLCSLCAWMASLQAGPVTVPNGSFESPELPFVAPYASTNIDQWQKPAQPSWYDPRQFSGAPWDSLMGEFYNVPFPGQFIDNCDGRQAAFLFAVPETGLFQDYDTVFGTNTTPSHEFNAKFNVGSSYDLSVGVIGGGGGMQPGATLQLSLYYRDAGGNRITVASTSITNSLELFPTNTHFVDFLVHVPAVQQTDPWAGENIGIQMLSTAGFDLAGGYWDLYNVRLTETLPTELRLAPVISGQISFTVLSEPGLAFEIQASPKFPATPSDWISLGSFTNSTGAMVFSDSTTNFNKRFYRTRKL